MALGQADGGDRQPGRDIAAEPIPSETGQASQHQEDCLSPRTAIASSIVPISPGAALSAPGSHVIHPAALSADVSRRRIGDVVLIGR